MSDWAHQLISKCLQRSARRAISPINLYRTRNLSFATSGIAPWWIIEVNACLSNDSKRGPSGGSVPWFLRAFASFLNSCFGDFSVCVCVTRSLLCSSSSLSYSTVRFADCFFMARTSLSDFCRAVKQTDFSFSLRSHLLCLSLPPLTSSPPHLLWILPTDCVSSTLPFLVASSSSFRLFTSSFRVLFSSCGPGPFFPASGSSRPASRSF